MTEPVIRISASKEVDRGSRKGEPLTREKAKPTDEENENDRVDISDEARDRSSGRRRRNIIEYLEDAENS